MINCFKWIDKIVLAIREPLNNYISGLKSYAGLNVATIYWFPFFLNSYVLLFTFKKGFHTELL